MCHGLIGRDSQSSVFDISFAGSAFQPVAGIVRTNPFLVPFVRAETFHSLQKQLELLTEIFRQIAKILVTIKRESFSMRILKIRKSELEDQKESNGWRLKMVGKKCRKLLNARETRCAKFKRISCLVRNHGKNSN